MTTIYTLEEARQTSRHKAVLLYAASCPKCRWMARVVLGWSTGAITGVPLDVPQWQHFYAEELPESRGWPVLVREGEPYWGFKLYPMTLLIAAGGWWRSLGWDQ